MERKRLGISVRDALKLEAFSGVEVIAGAWGLDRKILHINVMEVPDILDWVQEGELLLTTLYSLRDDPKEQVELIPKLAAKRVAALAVKPKRYINEIPQEAINKANALNFPLLQLPQEAAFGQIMEPLLNEIFKFQTTLLNKSELAHNRLLDVVLSGGGLDKIVSVLEELICGEVHVLDTEWNRLASKEGQLPEIASKLGSGQDDGKPSTQLVEPVVAAGRNLGYLVAFRKSGAFSVLDEITVERAATVVALELMNQISLKEVERRHRNEFVIELLGGSFLSDDTARQRARDNGWQLFDRNEVLLIQIVDFTSQSQKDKLLKYFLEELCQNAIYGEIGRDVILILPTADPCCHDLTQCLRQHVPKIERLIGSKVLIGIGRDASRISEIRTSFRQARQAANTASRVKGFDSIIHYDQLGIYRLLTEMDREEIKTFVADFLQPIIDYDSENNINLYETLRHYFTAGGNVRQVAKDMYVHYNTVIYRLERIEKLLGVKLVNPEQRLNLEIAVKAREMLEESE